MSAVKPWDWARLDAEAAADTWSELAAWVEWLVARYDLADEVPACWWAHPAITEELTALWTAWLAAYQYAEAHPDKPLSWHKELDASRTRIKSWDRLGCAREPHRSAGPGRWDFAEDDFVAHVRADVFARAGRRQLRSV